MTYELLVVNTNPQTDSLNDGLPDVYDVQVFVNNVAAICEGTCQFQYSSDATPIVSSVSPTSISDSSVITVNGAGFGTQSSSLDITVGKQNCVVLAVSDNVATCLLAGLALGKQNVQLNRAGSFFLNIELEIKK